MTTSSQPCPYCSLVHEGTCPRISAIEYHRDGTIKRVEFHDVTPAPSDTAIGTVAGLDKASVNMGGRVTP